MAAPDDRHYWLVANLIGEGQVIPFLGAGANLCDRPDDAVFELGGDYLPSGSELADELAKGVRYPLTDLDLPRVSQYFDAKLGERGLYKSLHTLFDANYPPSSLHHLLASLPPLLRERGSPQLLILTTNYDDALERACAERGEEYDLVWYEAKRGGVRGTFLHRPPGGEPVVIERPNEYADLAPQDRMVILKLHGAIDRLERAHDSYVITEDHYIDYLSGDDIAGQVPITLRERMADSHFLFLGYSMHDWNLRVVLNRIWGSQQLDLTSWSIQREPADPGVREIEETLWRNRGDGVELFYVPLNEYVAALELQLATDAGGTST